MKFPATVGELGPGEWRAGGTDLMERRRSGVSRGDIEDLRDVGGLDTIEEITGGVVIGARVTIARLAADPRIPVGLAQAARTLATPQIRAVATVGGNLAQHVHCWYYRDEGQHCLRKGGPTCLAREGDHLYHGCFDVPGGCAAPHPSTLACALLAYDATAHVEGQGVVPVLDAEGFVSALHVPVVPERAAYFRTISRARAEWPLVECMVRLRLDGAVITEARVVVGGVANLPLRREAVEARLVGKQATAEVFLEASRAASEGANPMPMTAYKVALLGPTVLETLERAVRA